MRPGRPDLDRPGLPPRGPPGPRRPRRRSTSDAIDLLFIENVGNLICPVGFDLGQAAKVGLFSLTEGDDKAAKHPYLVETADLLLLNKIDLRRT